MDTKTEHSIEINPSSESLHNRGNGFKKMQKLSRDNIVEHSVGSKSVTMDTKTEHSVGSKSVTMDTKTELSAGSKSVSMDTKTEHSAEVSVTLPDNDKDKVIVHALDDRNVNNINARLEKEFIVTNVTSPELFRENEQSCDEMKNFDIEIGNFVNDGNHFYQGKHIRVSPDNIDELNVDGEVDKQQNKIPKEPVSIEINAKKSVKMEPGFATDTDLKSSTKQPKMSDNVAWKRKLCVSQNQTKQLPGNLGNSLGDVYSFNEEDAGDDGVDFSYKSFDKNVLHKRKRSANFCSNRTYSNNLSLTRNKSDLSASLFVPNSTRPSSSMSKVRNHRHAQKTLNECRTSTELSTSGTAYCATSNCSGLSLQAVKNYDNSKLISGGMVESIGERDERLEAIRKVSLWIDGCTEHAISLVKSDTPLDSHWSSQTHLDKDNMAVFSDVDKNVGFSTRPVNNVKTTPGYRLNSLTGSSLISSSSASDGLVSDIRSMSGVHSNSSSGSPVFPLLNKSDGLVLADGSTALSSSQSACVSDFGLKSATNDLMLGKCANKPFNRDAGRMVIQTSTSGVDHMTYTSSSTRSVECDYTIHDNIHNSCVSNRTVLINSKANVDNSVLDNTSQSKKSFGTCRNEGSVYRDSNNLHRLHTSNEQKSRNNYEVKNDILETMAAEKSVVLDSCDTASVPFDWILEQNVGTYSGNKNGLNIKVSPGNCSVLDGVIKNEEHEESLRLFSISKGEFNEKNGLTSNLRTELKKNYAKIASEQFPKTRSISRNLSVLDKPIGADMWGLGSYSNVNLVNSEDVHKCLNGVDGAGYSLQTGSKINKSVKNLGTQSKLGNKMMLNAPKGEITKSNNCDGKSSNFCSNKLDSSLYLSSDVPDCDDNSLNLTTEEFQIAYRESLEKVYKLRDIDKSVDVEDLTTESINEDSSVQMNENSLTKKALLPESSPSSFSGIENVRYVSKNTGLDNEPSIGACSTDSNQLSAVKELHAYISPYCPPLLAESQKITPDSKLASAWSTSLDSVLINQSKYLNSQNGLVTPDNVTFSKITTNPISVSSVISENSLVSKGIQNCPNDREDFQTILGVGNNVGNNVNDTSNEISDHGFVLDEAGFIDNMTEDYSWNETLKSFIMQNLDNEPKGEIKEQDSSNVKLLLEQKLAEQYLNRNIESLKRKNSFDS